MNGRQAAFGLSDEITEEFETPNEVLWAEVLVVGTVAQHVIGGDPCSSFLRMHQRRDYHVGDHRYMRASWIGSGRCHMT